VELGVIFDSESGILNRIAELKRIVDDSRFKGRKMSIRANIAIG
jgi:hypothetical protein